MNDQLAHLYPEWDVARSVLFGETLTAPCGDTRVLTRESVDAAAHKPICHKCVDEVDATVDDYQINAATGWVAYLERFAAAILTVAQLHREEPDAR